jgi:hypothetical protein
MGDIVLAGATSGTTTLTPTAVSGTTTLTLPATSGTIITTGGGAAGSFTTLTSSADASFATSSGNVGIGTASPISKFTVNGNITPSAAPSAFWGLDYAPSSSSGTYITIANNGTYNFASGSGATFVYEDSGTTGAVMFMSVYGSTYTVWQSGTGYSNVPGTASKVNFGYNSGVGAYYLENKTGSSKNLYISNIRMRSGS